MNLLFICCAALLFSIIIAYGVRYLPRERWQMLAVIPTQKEENGTWHGANLTSYGFLIATSTVCSVLYSLILLQAASAPLTGVLAVVGLLFLICIPASRWVAGIVEKKQHTFTIGGSFFCGLLITPVLILLVNATWAWKKLPTMDIQIVLAAISIGYILGEGLGRLACISYGCCYGKPLRDCSPLTRRLYNRVAFVFNGNTQKAVYEGKLAGEKLVPVQGITCVIYTFAALVSTLLFLQSRFTEAFLLSLFVSQLWRIYSETLRADFRGFTKFSAYQKMSLAALPYGVLLTFLPVSTHQIVPSIEKGLMILSQPLPMISIQLLWVVLFFWFGRSTVTSSTLRLHVVHKHI